MMGKKFRKRKFTKIKDMVVIAQRPPRVPRRVTKKRRTTMCITVKLPQKSKGSSSVGIKEIYRIATKKGNDLLNSSTENPEDETAVSLKDLRENDF